MAKLRTDIDYAGWTGRELPGEHWNARIIRESAELTARGTMQCTYHGEVPYEHICQRPGESAPETTARAFGEARDV